MLKKNKKKKKKKIYIYIYIYNNNDRIDIILNHKFMTLNKINN